MINPTTQSPSQRAVLASVTVLVGAAAITTLALGALSYLGHITLASQSVSQIMVIAGSATCFAEVGALITALAIRSCRRQTTGDEESEESEPPVTPTPRQRNRESRTDPLGNAGETEAEELGESTPPSTPVSSPRGETPDATPSRKTHKKGGNLRDLAFPNGSYLYGRGADGKQMIYMVKKMDGTTCSYTADEVTKDPDLIAGLTNLEDAFDLAENYAHSGWIPAGQVAVIKLEPVKGVRENELWAAVYVKDMGYGSREHVVRFGNNYYEARDHLNKLTFQDKIRAGQHLAQALLNEKKITLDLLKNKQWFEIDQVAYQQRVYYLFVERLQDGNLYMEARPTTRIADILDPEGGSVEVKWTTLVEAE